MESVPHGGGGGGSLGGEAAVWGRPPGSAGWGPGSLTFGQVGSSGGRVGQGVRATQGPDPSTDFTAYGKHPDQAQHLPDLPLGEPGTCHQHVTGYLFIHVLLLSGTAS